MIFPLNVTLHTFMKRGRLNLMSYNCLCIPFQRMTTLYSVLAVALLSASAIASPTTVNAKLVGIFSKSSTAGVTCSLLSIDPNTGANTTISIVDICSMATQTYPAFATYDAQHNALAVVVQTAPQLIWYDVNTGSKVASVPIPNSGNSSDEFIGLANAQAVGIVLVRQSGVYTVSTAGVSLLVPAAFNTGSVVAASANEVFVGDGSSTSLYVVDLMRRNVRQLASGVNRVWDLQYSSALDALVELASYQLFVTDPTTGQSKNVMSIPDGPGYPRVNGISPAGDMFFFMDFATVYTIQLSNYSILTKAPFTAASHVIGFPVYLPTA